MNRLFVPLLLILSILSGCTDFQSDLAHTKMHISETFDGAIRHNESLMQKDENLPLPVEQALGSSEVTKIPEKKFSLNVKDLPIDKFISALASETGYDIVLKPGTKANVTLDLKDVTFPEVIKKLESLYSIDVEIGDANSYTIQPEKLITETFQLSGMTIIRQGVSSTNVSGAASGSDSSAQVSTSVANTDGFKEVTHTIAQIVGGALGSTLYLDKQNSTVTVRTTKTLMEKVKEYVDYTNSMTQKQVIIEAKILEVHLDKQSQTGLNFNSNNFSLNFSNANFEFRNITDTASGLLNNFSGVINLLSKQGDVHVLSSPRIATLNRKKALMKIGEDKYFLTESNRNTIAAANSVATQNVSIRSVFSGISLDVTPEILDNDNIIMHVHPMVTSVNSQTISGTLSGTTTTISVPQTMVRETDAVLHAHNNQIVIMAGLIEERVNNKKNKLRYGHLPVGQSDEVEFVELVILLQPRIVPPEVLIEKMKDYKNHLSGIKVSNNVS